VAPAHPTPPPSGWAAGTVLTVVSGETDASVAGARVVVAGMPHATDGTGQAVVQAAGEGATVDVEAPGFITRQTLVRHAATRITLWPDHAKLPADYTRALVYTAASFTDSTSLVPLDRLPPRVRTLALIPSEALAADPRAMAAHLLGAAYFNAALEGQTLVAVGGSADLKVPTSIDAANPLCTGTPGTLFASTWLSGHEVTAAEIVFCGEVVSRLPTPIAHELGHVFGLGHSPNNDDVMYRYYSPRYEHGFTDREALTMSLISQRRGGNAWPDNDRAAATTGRRVRVFVD
jgi:hypothetical protein